MKFEFDPAFLPTLSRFFLLNIKFPGNSILRQLQYESLVNCKFEGEVLDVGGGGNSRYSDLLSGELELSSINIDSKICPTFLLKEGEAFPVEDNVYDYVLSLNTLEHVYDSEFVLDEMLRVLKPGGIAYISVPFMFKIHGHPDDYSRQTPSWWRETIKRCGYSEMKIRPLVWGRYTTAGLITGYRGGLLPSRINSYWIHLKDIIYAKFCFFGKKYYEGRRGERIKGVALGWFITIKKPRVE